MTAIESMESLMKTHPNEEMTKMYHECMNSQGEFIRLNAKLHQWRKLLIEEHENGLVKQQQMIARLKA